MRLKNIILSSLALAASVSAAAQDAKTEYVFNPHWYVQGQVGGQYTLGEGSFGDLFSPNIQFSAGYNLTEVLGFRAGINAWQSKGAWDGMGKGKDYDWKYSYVAPNVDVVANLSHLIGGYNPERLFNVSVFAGIGMNIAFNNDEANEVNALLQSELGSTRQSLRNVWDGTKVRFQGRFGAMGDFRINDKFSVGLELQATVLNDNYNSKKATSADWYFNGLVGVKYNFGKTYSKRAVKVVDLENTNANVQERVVEKIVEKQVPGPVREVKVVEPLRQDIYFTISSNKVSLTEMQKVESLAEYLKKYPESKISITGYADKGTGNPNINLKISKKRAQVVADTLVEQFGIDSSRIVVDAKGDTAQPHKEQILNRVSVCIAK